MGLETSDIVYGAVGLVIFLIFVFVSGKLLYTFSNSRLTRAWEPLVSTINGTVTGDGGGAATSWMTGTYRGRRLQASISPNRNLYSDDSNAKYNYFEVSLLDVPGLSDWSVGYEEPSV